MKIDGIEYTGESNISALDTYKSGEFDSRIETTVRRDRENLIIEIDDSEKDLKDPSESYHIKKSIKIGINQLFDALNSLGYVSESFEKKLIKCEGNFDKERLNPSQPLFNRIQETLFYSGANWIDQNGNKIPCDELPEYEASKRTERVRIPASQIRPANGSGGSSSSGTLCPDDFLL